MKNHLKWARIKIHGDGKNCPSEISIERDEINFFIPIRVERKVQFQILTPTVEENHHLVMPELGKCSKETGGLPLSLDQQVLELSPTEKGQYFLKKSEGVQMGHMGLQR